MISTPASRARVTVQCGAGWVSGTPGDSTRASSVRKSTPPRSTTGTPWPAAVSREAPVSSHASTSAPPDTSAPAQARPDRASPNRATRLPANERAGNTWRYRSLSVERPTSASTTAMIQNRMTIVGSRQPFCSKWWCSGAMANTRLPVSL